MKKEKDIFEIIVERLDKNRVPVEIEGHTSLQFVDARRPESWPALTALAMAIQQAEGIDNGLEKATSGENKKVINDILSGRITLEP